METDKIFIEEIKPMFTSLVTTMDMYEGDQFIAGTHIIDTRKATQTIKEFQKVLAVGDSVRGINIGDLVCIDPTRFAKMVHEKGSIQEATIKDNPVVRYNFDTIELNGQPCLFLQDRDIKYIVVKYRELPKESDKPVSIITPPRQKFKLN